MTVSGSSGREGLASGAIHASIGQEAVASGVCGNLGRSDLLLSNHRGHGHTTGDGSGLLFGSLDVEHEFSDETEVKAGVERLKAEVQPTALSLGAGAVFDVGENVLVRTTAGYRASEGGASGYGGGLEMRVRF